MIDGLITLRSSHGPAETADRLVAAVESYGMTLMARIDHAAAAAKVGLDLGPTEVLIFGNPTAGTLLMQNVQLVGLELPLRALVWQDEAASTWVSCRDLAALATRYGLATTMRPTVEKMASLIKVVVDEAIR